LTRQSLGDLFREYEGILKTYEGHPENLQKRFEEKTPVEGEGRFWWFRNPTGKVILSTLKIGYEERIKKFYEEREALRQQKELLLAETFP
jgi:hypothetical protein